MNTVPLNNSHDPMAWQRAAEALRMIGQHDAADICHKTAGDMMRNANANDGVVIELKIEQ